MPSPPHDERDDETQRFSPKYPDEDFFEAIRACEDDGDLATTARIAEKVGCDRRTAYYRLGNFQDEDRVEKRPAGSVVVWELVNEE